MAGGGLRGRGHRQRQAIDGQAGRSRRGPQGVSIPGFPRLAAARDRGAARRAGRLASDRRPQRRRALHQRAGGVALLTPPRRRLFQARHRPPAAPGSQRACATHRELRRSALASDAAALPARQRAGRRLAIQPGRHAGRAAGSARSAALLPGALQLCRRAPWNCTAAFGSARAAQGPSVAQRPQPGALLADRPPGVL